MRKNIYSMLAAILLLPLTLSAQCDIPTGLTCTSYPNSATLSWSGENTGNYEVVYSIDGASSTSTVTASTNSTTITGLNSQTVYRAKVRKICSATEMSDFSEEILFATPTVAGGRAVVNYSADMIDSTDDNIAFSGFPMGNVFFGNLMAQSIIDSTFLSGMEGHGITHFGFNALNATGASYLNGVDIYMANIDEDTFEYEVIAPDASHVFHKVMDNGDCSFSGTGWKFFELDSIFEWDGNSNILFSVINNNVSSSFMYESPYYNSHYSPNVSPKHMLYWGSDNITLDDLDDGISIPLMFFTSDLMFLSTEVGCPAPEGLYASDITLQSAILNWTNSATNYELQYKAVNDDDWSPIISLIGNIYQLTGLTVETPYLFHVRNLCIDDGDTNYSEWSSGSFSTLTLECDAPTNLISTATTYSTIGINWVAGNTATVWNIHVWNDLFDSVYTANTHPFTITGLEPNKTYNIAVSSNCLSIKESDYSDTITLTTLVCNDQVSGLTTTDITTNSVKLVWGGSGVGYEIEYGELHFTEGENTTIVHSSNNNYTITGLQPGHNYSASVRIECEDGILGPFCEQIDFTTLESGEGIETANTANVAIYPNPTSDAATVSISGINGTIEVLVIDLNGRIVLSEQLECSGDCTKQMHLSSLAQGTYLVQLKGEELNTVQKLLIK